MAHERYIVKLPCGQTNNHFTLLYYIINEENKNNKTKGINWLKI